ncbi:PEP-CTERM sorting domain-containing protein [Cerasicoccus arenae]|uniref:PEP-CTERM protein-sorting domain-containing protein n=1 Tax=Cerasicoccus arenae TaxID=424488 RepID=A0A8J3DBR0_9BACT|nr:PEP-CTERM sorting domain-containing protein [Cerasicoccus arenae]MBK1857211.1 PEP-CTERM sorting domain-containing protein [Cerasicoccus arenae]GHC00025.1 hypothetical protein GCM10007047_15310 [Cerasicoccus arenae]
MAALKKTILIGISLATTLAFGIDAGDVDGTDLADTIVIGSSNISSDQNLTYNDGTGNQTGSATSAYSVFNANSATPINLNAKAGADSITVNGFGATEINIDGGFGYNTITISSGATLIGNINGGSESQSSSASNTINLNGTVLGDIGNASISGTGTDSSGLFIQGAVGTIDGDYKPAYNVTLEYVTIGNASGYGSGVTATGLIQISNSTISGKIDNRLSPEEAGIIMDNGGGSDILSRGPIQLQQSGATIISNIESSSQAPISVQQGGGGAILSRGVITINEAGSGLIENLQVAPDADNPGIYVTLGGGGDISSDGPVQMSTGGAGLVMSSDTTLGSGGNASEIMGRDIEALDYVDKVTLQSGSSSEKISLGDGNDLFIVEDLTNVALSGLADASTGDSDLFSAQGFTIADLGLFFQSDGAVVHLGDDITEGFSLANFELLEFTDDDVSEAEAATYGESLTLIFFDPEFSDPLESLQVYINGALSDESTLTDYMLPTDGTTTQFTFTGDNPDNGNPLQFDFYATVPEPRSTAVLLMLAIGSLAMVRRRKTIHKA